MATTETGRLSRFATQFRELYRETWLGYVLVFPALALVTVIILYPIAVGVWNGFFERSLLYPDRTTWVGFGNYAQLIKDQVFIGSVGRTVLLTAVAVSLEYLLGLCLAVLLKQKVPGIGLFRSLAMTTWVIPTVVTVTIFNFMFQTEFGVINILLDSIGLPTRYWLGDPQLAFPIIISIHVWRNAPFFAIALMAGMLSVPDDLYEAAEMDGAGKIEQFRYVTLPNISHISMIMIILHVIYTFNNFEIVYLATGGGPLFSTEVLATLVYKEAFVRSALGYGAAMGTVMLIIMLVFTVVYLTIEEMN